MRAQGTPREVKLLIWHFPRIFSYRFERFDNGFLSSNCVALRPIGRFTGNVLTSSPETYSAFVRFMRPVAPVTHFLLHRAFKVRRVSGGRGNGSDISNTPVTPLVGLKYIHGRGSFCSLVEGIGSASGIEGVLWHSWAFFLLKPPLH